MEHLKSKLRWMPPSILTPEVRFADRGRTGFDILEEVKRHSKICDLIMIRGEQRDDSCYQTAVIAYLN